MQVSQLTSAGIEKEKSLKQIYKLMPMDLLRVEIGEEPEFPKEVRVAADGTVSLPHIRKVAVGGKTLYETEKIITDLYLDGYYIDPQVQIQIIEYAERKVQVLGQVNKPGNVLIPPEENLTLTKAISGAEGLNLRADSHAVQIRRLNTDGKIEVVKVDFMSILKKPDSEDIYLKNGDTIFVPESIF